MVEVGEGGFFGEQALLRREPQEATVTALTPVKALRLTARAFTRVIKERDHRVLLLHRCKIFDALSDDDVRALAGVLEQRSFSDGQMILVQGTTGSHIFLMASGCAVAIIRHGEGERVTKQEAMTYYEGDFFGELAVLENKPRCASVVAVGAVTAYCLTRSEFERTVGPVDRLQPQKYHSDPRQLIHLFYQPGDSRGPAGSLIARGLTPGGGQSAWFSVFRQCGRDSIAKMLSRAGVGRASNIKGKAAGSRLSGFVPFLQISEDRQRRPSACGPLRGHTVLSLATP